MLYRSVAFCASVYTGVESISKPRIIAHLRFILKGQLRLNNFLFSNRHPVNSRKRDFDDPNHEIQMTLSRTFVARLICLVSQSLKARMHSDSNKQKTRYRRKT